MGLIQSPSSPTALGFEKALANVPLVISFATYPDETAAQSDFIFPDHNPLESWGYQFPVPAANRAVISGFQPVVIPFYNTRATTDVLLASIQAIGGYLAETIPYKDEVEYLQHSVKSSCVTRMVILTLLRSTPFGRNGSSTVVGGNRRRV